MRKPTVNGHKGKVNSRNRGTGLTAKRMTDLIGEYVDKPVSDRRLLVTQWRKLVAARVPYSAITAEYGVSGGTISKALANPEGWIHLTTLRHCSLKGVVLRSRKSSETRRRRRARKYA